MEARALILVVSARPGEGRYRITNVWFSLVPSSQGEERGAVPGGAAGGAVQAAWQDSGGAEEEGGAGRSRPPAAEESAAADQGDDSRPSAPCGSSRGNTEAGSEFRIRPSPRHPPLLIGR